VPPRGAHAGTRVAHRPARLLADQRRRNARPAAGDERGGARRLVVASTCVVYGERKTRPIDENAATAPTSPYGTSKLAADNAAMDLAGTGAMHVADMADAFARGRPQALPVQVRCCEEQRDEEADAEELPPAGMAPVPLSHPVLAGLPPDEPTSLAGEGEDRKGDEDRETQHVMIITSHRIGCHRFL